MEPESDQLPVDQAVVSVIPASSRIVAIEFPGYVRNVDLATRMLGGVEGVAAAMNTTGSTLNPGGLMRVSFRPDDPTCHPLIGDQQPVTGLLLRISRPRTNAADVPTKTAGSCGRPAAPSSAPHVDIDQPQAPSLITAKVVAAVSTTFRFTGLADYQYLPHDPASNLRNQNVGQDDGPAALQVPAENLAGRAGECTLTGPEGRQRRSCLIPLISSHGRTLQNSGAIAHRASCIRKERPSDGVQFQAVQVSSSWI